MEFGLKILFAYLLGSVSGSLVVGRMRGGVDIRKLGSGNAGGTNALRTQGAGFAVPVLIIDVVKGVLAVAVVPFIAWPDAGSSASQAWLPALCGIAAVLGHVLPVWHGFRGGKGVATLLGALAALEPALLVPVLVAWTVVVIAFRYVGFASVVAAAVLPLAAVALRSEPFAPVLAFSLFGAALIAWTHRGNLARMRRGTESRTGRVPFGRRSP